MKQGLVNLMDYVDSPKRPVVPEIAKPPNPLDPTFRVRTTSGKEYYQDRWGHYHRKKDRLARVITDGPGPMVRLTLNKEITDRIRKELGIKQLKSIITTLLKDWALEKNREQGRIR